MEFQITEAQSKQARLPHELFLINLITNHILLFVGLLGMMKTYPVLALVTPGISIVVLSYLLIRGRKELNNDSWYVMAHWQLCMRRSRFFVGMLLFMGLVITGLILSVGGDASQLKPGHYAMGGVAFLPGMFTVLALIVMESDAMHHAKTGRVPDGMVSRFPNPQEVIKGSL
ncbi:MAG: hypothetical protein GQ470_05745 [Gammaproteobacteria bacterium]|nr:hypothetical protein [Gammaproteobacteria bacterium]